MRRGVLALLVLAAALAPQAASHAGHATPGLASPVCAGADGFAASFGGRRTFFLAPGTMLRLKAAIATDPATKAAYGALIARAERAMARPLYTVVDKKTAPPSGDPHDYMSLAPYWWPDPAKPGGLPYVRRDGEFNPDRSTDKFDVTDLEGMSADVETLSLAYFFSDDARYAGRAASLVRTWFLAPATRMNPNMNYAQAVPGREEGRAEGVLDTSRLARVVEGIGLIGPSGKLSAEEQKGLEKWFSDYLDWMQTSRNGKAENAARNNHGMWFDAQTAQFALFARRPEMTRAVAEAFGRKRIAPQITPEGKMPLELARTRSLHYSIYALFAAYDVADMAKCMGVDVWNHADGGKSLRAATNYLKPYYRKVEAWPLPELRPDAAELDELMRRARGAWGEGYPLAPETELKRYFGTAPGPSEPNKAN
ncbi:alginate lyase family protein [Sphingomonas sp. HITSZ_GF]|uniref:alginate lyase family protein n=1 Tax=Sphingomonas sp. HITSZ_GF TaxID=3037247 RepID=UPI00240D0605|nr:alginate lyase family protein [Sphingomonas sp. HITSZ_GF]MDG2535492.1 alginate lyase family protein [Sphingomonas sp. HITSZ_GF]